MDNNTEGLEPQKIQEETAPQADVISEDELAELKHKAEVSSQNFERLKKAEEENETLRRQLETNQSSSKPEDKDLKQRLTALEQTLLKQELVEANPILKDVWKEFQDYHSHPDNVGMSLKTAAKAFLVEKELITPTRKGLENPTGGDKKPPSGMNSDDIARLRTNNFRQYRDMLKKGQIKV